MPSPSPSSGAGPGPSAACPWPRWPRARRRRRWPGGAPRLGHRRVGSGRRRWCGALGRLGPPLAPGRRRRRRARGGDARRLAGAARGAGRRAAAGRRRAGRRRSAGAGGHQRRRRGVRPPRRGHRPDRGRGRPDRVAGERGVARRAAARLGRGPHLVGAGPQPRRHADRRRHRGRLAHHVPQRVGRVQPRWHPGRPLRQGPPGPVRRVRAVPRPDDVARRRRRPPRRRRARHRPAVVDTVDGPMGVVISWEVFFTDRADDAIDNGGQALLNPTNGASYWLTQVQTQQVASSRLRGIETGRWVLQAAPTGLSAIADPDGAVVTCTLVRPGGTTEGTCRSDVSEQVVLQATIDRRTGPTIARAVDAWPTLLASIAALIGANVWDRRRRGLADAADAGVTPPAGA
ncbi:MAG: nitrilase-related carbon-nitrogen hydrolase [Acidimicrobiales bacterium]